MNVSHTDPDRAAPRSEGQRHGRHKDRLLSGAALLVLVVLLLGFMRLWPAMQQPSQTTGALSLGAGLANAVDTSPAKVASPAPQPTQVPRRAQFGKEPASAEARQIAAWALHSGDNQNRAVVVVDKMHAKVYVFDRDGALQGAAPALMGSAIGDHTVPGVGDKPVGQVLPEERTTPAGRFVAETGLNANGEDVVWVDYDAAVSMHRVRANVKAERRLERLASSTAADNRISFGCINLPVSFYEKVLSPLVRGTGAVVYVLPETQPAAAFFGAYDLPAQ